MSVFISCLSVREFYKHQTICYHTLHRKDLKHRHKPKELFTYCHKNWPPFRNKLQATLILFHPHIIGHTPMRWDVVQSDTEVQSARGEGREVNTNTRWNCDTASIMCLPRLSLLLFLGSS